jgi:hypothetical protein
VVSVYSACNASPLPDLSSVEFPTFVETQQQYPQPRSAFPVRLPLALRRSRCPLPASRERALQRLPSTPPPPFRVLQWGHQECGTSSQQLIVVSPFQSVGQEVEVCPIHSPLRPLSLIARSIRLASQLDIAKLAFPFLRYEFGGGRKVGRVLIQEGINSDTVYSNCRLLAFGLTLLLSMLRVRKAV